MELLDIDRVLVRTGMDRSTLYRRMKDSRFPKPVRVRGHGFWVSHEVDAWLNEVSRVKQEVLDHPECLEAGVTITELKRKRSIGSWHPAINRAALLELERQGLVSMRKVKTMGNTRREYRWRVNRMPVGS